MVDGVVLVVDASHGPGGDFFSIFPFFHFSIFHFFFFSLLLCYILGHIFSLSLSLFLTPFAVQTKFVLSKALQKGLKPLVVLNKMDRPSRQVAATEGKIFDLFCSLGADDEFDFLFPSLPFFPSPAYFTFFSGKWSMKRCMPQRKKIGPILSQREDNKGIVLSHSLSLSLIHLPTLKAFLQNGSLVRGCFGSPPRTQTQPRFNFFLSFFLSFFLFFLFFLPSFLPSSLLPFVHLISLRKWICHVGFSPRIRRPFRQNCGWICHFWNPEDWRPNRCHQP